MFASKEWVIDLLKKIKNNGGFFDPTRLKYKYTTETLYSSSAKEQLGQTEVKTLGTIPTGISSATVAITLKRESGSCSGSAYPRISIYKNGTLLGGDTTDMYQNTSYNYNFNDLTGGDVITIKFSDSASSYSYQGYFTFKLVATGKEIIYEEVS